jgi:molecular chaperone GrpE
MKDTDNTQQDELELEPTLEDNTEEADLEAEEGAFAAKMKKLRDQLAKCEKEKMGYLEDLQRTKADFLNGKRRLEEQLTSDRKRIVMKHIEELLPLADSFEMSRMDEDSWKEADAAWQKGIVQIHSQLQSILGKYGVARVGTVGDAFDPAIHEAVANEPVTEKDKHHTITAVLQSGYTMEGSIIRPARVTVGEYTE